MPLKSILTADEFTRLAKPEQFAYRQDGERYVVDLADSPPGFVLQADFDAERARVDEFRTNNRNLNARLTAFGDLDPDKAKAALASNDQQRVKELEEKLAATTLKTTAAWEFLKAGGRPEAREFIESKAASVFKVSPDGKLTSDQPSKHNPAAKLTVTEWIGMLAQESPFAFHPSRGGGAVPHGTSPRPSKAVKTVSGDPVSFGQNLEGIASGAVRVDQG